MPKPGKWNKRFLEALLEDAPEVRTGTPFDHDDANGHAQRYDAGPESGED